MGAVAEGFTVKGASGRLYQLRIPTVRDALELESRIERIGGFKRSEIDILQCAHRGVTELFPDDNDDGRKYLELISLQTAELLKAALSPRQDQTIEEYLEAKRLPDVLVNLLYELERCYPPMREMVADQKLYPIKRVEAFCRFFITSWQDDTATCRLLFGELTDESYELVPLEDRRIIADQIDSRLKEAVSTKKNSDASSSPASSQKGSKAGRKSRRPVTKNGNSTVPKQAAKS